MWTVCRTSGASAVTGFGLRCGWDRGDRRALVIDPYVGLTLASGLLLTGLAAPLLGMSLARHMAARVAPLRADFTIAALDLIQGAPTWPPTVPQGDWLVASAAGTTTVTVERTLARRAFALDCGGPWIRSSAAMVKSARSGATRAAMWRASDIPSSGAANPVSNSPLARVSPHKGR